MSRVRGKLTFENVLVTVVAFVVLAGGSAFAANQLAKNSVGKRQLKANSVTTAKIKKGAVTKTKIRDGAVDGAKVQDGSLGSGSLNLPNMPFAQVVHEARGVSTVAVGGTPTIVPLDRPTYTQAAGRTDIFTASVDVTFEAGCKEEREVEAFLVIDAADPASPGVADIALAGGWHDESEGTLTKRLMLSADEGGGVQFRPAVPTGHALAIGLEAVCKSGAGVTASNAAVDVIGVR